jgi:hypothetical protein
MLSLQPPLEALEEMKSPCAKLEGRACRPSGSYCISANPLDADFIAEACREVQGAHIDILPGARYGHLECLLKNRKNALSCCRAPWTC